MRHLRQSVLALSCATLSIGCEMLGGDSAEKGGSAASTAASGDVEAAILALLEQHRVALLNKDIATLERIWADDFVFINYRGQLVTRAQRLENVRTGATAFKSVTYGEEIVRPYGDAAVLIGMVTLEGQYSGVEEGGGSYRFVAVCTRHAEAWKISVLEMTRLEK